MGRLLYIEATTLGDAWFQALYRIMDGSKENKRQYLVSKGSWEGTYRTGRAVTIEIKYPGVRPLAPQMPEGSNIPPPTTEEDIEEYCLYLMTPERKENEHYTYGEDLWWQIEWVIDYYKKVGFGTNHCYMSVGRPETLYHYDRDIAYCEVVSIRDRETDQVRQYQRDNFWNQDEENRPSSQCLRGIDTWIEENKLHFWAYFRSWDLWGGFPVNLGGIQLVKEYMADQISVEDGSMIVSCKDLHIYEHAEAVAAMRLGRAHTEGEEGK